MNTFYIRWLVAGIGALLLMSSFTIYLILRDRQKIDASFVSYRVCVDSLYALRGYERELQLYPMVDASVPRVRVQDTTLRNLRIHEAELKLQSEHLLADTQEIIRLSENKKLLWASLMGVTGLVGLSLIFVGRKRA